jgi:predicted dehydrogenase
LIEDFVEVLRSGKDPFTRGEDGLEALKVVDAAYKSFREGQEIQIC